MLSCEIPLNGACFKADAEARTLLLSKGALKNEVHWPLGVDVREVSGTLVVSSESKAMLGTARSIIGSGILGLFKPFSGELEVVGVGYSVRKEGQSLAFSLGYSHLVILKLPPESEVSFSLLSDRRIRVSSPSKRELGYWLARAELLKVPNPYTGNGIYVVGKDYVRKKMKKS